MSTTRRFGPYQVELDNLDKVLFPDTWITKGEVVDHYEGVAPWILPHLEGRPLTLQRFPDGIGEEGFYQKSVPDHFPDWVSRVEVPLAEGGRQEQVTAENTATLVYLAQQGTLTLHPWLSRAPSLLQPDRMVVDLDPGEGGDFSQVRSAALRLKDLLDAVGLPPLVMLTGSSGAHLVTPLRVGPDFDQVRKLARRLVEHLVEEQPEELTVAPRKVERRGRLYLDVARNARGQTAVAPYALRALPGAPVATPLTWEEFRRTRDPRRHTLTSIRHRLEETGDPWKGVGRRARSLDRARREADRLLGGGGAAG